MYSPAPLMPTPPKGTPNGYSLLNPHKLLSCKPLDKRNTPAAATSSCVGRRHGLRWQLLNLPYQEALLVDELLVFGSVFEERWEEAEELLAVADQDPLHCQRLVGVCHKHLHS
jgi:hypothetical protein